MVELMVSTYIFYRPDVHTGLMPCTLTTLLNTFIMEVSDMPRVASVSQSFLVRVPAVADILSSHGHRFQSLLVISSIYS